MKSRALLVMSLLAACAGGCAAPESAPSSPESGTAAEAAPMPGSDRDAHGCIPSAGYRWCTETARCERPWELAREKGFAQTAEAFDAFCRNPADG